MVEEEVVSKSVTKKRRDDVKGQMNSEKRGVFGARKVRTPGFVDYSSSDDSTENAFSEKSLVESNKRTLLGGKSPENQAQQVSMTAIMRSPVLESLSS